MKIKSILAGLTVATFAIGTTLRVEAQPTMDGTLDGSYGSALAVQTINTGFGNSTYTGSPNGPDANGSEIDAGYGLVSGGYLYLFIAGNYENNGNHLNIFIADGRSGQSTLSTSVGSLGNMNGSVFSSGFSATFALDMNDYQGTVYSDAADLVANNGGYQGAVGLSSGIGSGTLSDGIILALNNSHVSTMGSSGTALSGATSGANTLTGMELAIPLSLLGNPTGNILVLADINGGGDGYLANQFLAGLPVGTGNVGGGGPYTGSSSGQFNFGSTPGEYFTVAPAPEPSTMALLGLSGLGALLIARRRK